MLKAFNIKYFPHTTVKRQVLADIVAKLIEGMEKDGIKMGGTPNMEVSFVLTSHPPFWELYMDEVAN